MDKFIDFSYRSSLQGFDVAPLWALVFSTALLIGQVLQIFNLTSVRLFCSQASSIKREYDHAASTNGAGRSFAADLQQPSPALLAAFGGGKAARVTNGSDSHPDGDSRRGGLSSGEVSS